MDAVVLIRPNHGGFSSLRPVSSLNLVREVMAECGLPQTGRAAAVGGHRQSDWQCKRIRPVAWAILRGPWPDIDRVCEEIA